MKYLDADYRVMKQVITRVWTEMTQQKIDHKLSHKSLFSQKGKQNKQTKRM